MRAVNLLPKEDRAGKRGRPRARLLLAPLVPVALAGLLAMAGSWQRGAVADKEATLSALEHQLAMLPAPTPVDPQSTALVAERNERIAALSGALSGRIAFDRLLRELSLVLPDDVWLTNLTARSPVVVADTGAAAPAGQTTGAPAGSAAAPPPPASAEGGDSTFVLTGSTYSQEGVARLLARLSVVPYLADVRLQKSALSAATKRRVVEFTILADVRSPKDAA